MALPGAARTAAILRGLADRMSGSDSTPTTTGSSLVKLSPEKRMIGFNAGLPQGRIVDPTLQTSGAIPLRGEAPTDYQRNGTTVRIRGFERHPVVQACVRAVVDIASAVPIQVYAKKAASGSSGFSDEITVMTSKHPLQQLLDAPNSFLSAQRFRAFMMTHYVIYGNTLTFLERPTAASSQDTPNTKPPQSLRIVHPEDVLTVYVNNKGYPLWYLWRDQLGYTHTSPVQDLLHVRDLNAKGLVFGFPRAASALNDIIGDDEASQYVRQTVTNSGQAGLWLIANEETTPAEARIVEDQLHEQMVTRGGRGRTKVLGGIKDVKSVAFSLRDLEFPDLRRVSREDICAAFGVDPRMIGITSASRDAGLSGTQYIEARVRLIKQTIEPMLRALESEMNLWLAPEFGDIYVRFDPDSLAALTEDRDATSKRVLAELAAGARTVEETREVLELNPEFDEDDTLATGVGVTLTPVAVAMQPPTPDVPPDDQSLPAADAGTTSKQPKVTDTGTDLQDTEGKDPNNPGGKGPKMTDGGKDPTPKKRAASAPKNVRTQQRVLLRGVVLSPEQRTILWQQFDTRAAKDELPYKRQAMILFGEERANVARVFDRQQAALGPSASPEVEASHVNAAKRQIRQMYKPSGDVEKRWVDRFHPLIGGTYAKGAAQVVEGLTKNRSVLRAGKGGAKKGAASAAPVADSVDYTFHMEAPDVQAAIRARAAKLAQHVGKTTAETIGDAIEIGVREGMSMSEIARLVDKTAFGSNAGYRATMIARTETAGALNAGEFDAATASGTVEGKEWLTQGDDRVRDSHFEAEAEGQVAMDEPFETNGMMYPGDPDGDADEVINCRCTLLYYDALDAGTSALPNPGEPME